MATKNSIQVGIKLRPFVAKEKELTSCWKVVDNSIQLETQSEPYCFDHIFGEDASNQLIFDKMAKHIVHAGLKGFNGTIFAYGQTSSGKTYTMLGDDENPGVMMLAATEIFKEIERNTDRQFLLRVGYIEIYNEKIFDLFDRKNQDLKIHETSTGLVSVNCQEHIITSEQDLLRRLLAGSKERTVGGTNMNERSSRSHAIFRIIIESRRYDRTTDDAVTLSVLNLVDLAGSERAGQTGATGTRLKEGGHINKSLMFLSNVIKRLSENEDDKYVSYRDSKLTRILQASLGGNALTSIICTIKPAAVEETQSTLSFALRAKSIKNKPKVNEIVSDATMMKRLESKISELEKCLADERRLNESQIKVGELEKRLKNEVLKIISSNSLNNMRSVELRRRTWCPATTSDAAQRLPIPTKPTKIPTSGTPSNGQPSRLRKPGQYFTPHITMRPSSEEILAASKLETKSVAIAEAVDEEFKPAASCDFDAVWDGCQTPKSESRRTATLTPVVTANPLAKLELVENALSELQEFTNAERNLAVEHEVLAALKDKLHLVTQRNSELEGERLEYIRLKTELDTFKSDLNEAEKRCEELQIANVRLAELQRTAAAAMAERESELATLKTTAASLEDENRKAVSLQFEFDLQRNKAEQRERELLSALDEKTDEVEKLVKSLNTAKSEMKEWINSRTALRHSTVHEIRNAATSADGSETTNGDAGSGSCTKCCEFEALLAKHKSVQLDFEQLTAEYEKLRNSYSAAMADSTETQSKLRDLEQTLQREQLDGQKLRAEITSLRDQLEGVQREYAELNSDNNIKTERCEELNGMVEAAQEQMRQLQDKCNALEEQQQILASIQQEYETVQEKYNKLQAAYDQLDKAPPPPQPELLAAAAEKTDECLRLQAENEQLQQEIKLLMGRVEQAQAELQVSVAATQQRELEMQELKAQNTQLLAEVDSLRADTLQTEKQLASSEEENLRKELDKQRSEGDLLRAKGDQLQTQLEEMQKEYDDLSNQLMDSLQEGESLREQCARLETDLKMYKEQAEQLTMLEEQINCMKVQLMESTANITASRADSLMSESLRSSGVGLERDTTIQPALEENLAKFLSYADSLQAIEFEQTNGRSRVFTSQAAANDNETSLGYAYKLHLTDLSEVHETSSSMSSPSVTSNEKVHMHGTLASQTFRILEFTPHRPQQQEEVAEQPPNEEVITLRCTNAELQQRLDVLTASNDERGILLESTELKIHELREQISRLSEELFEKSTFIERCACEEYQKQIKDLERERLEMSILCDGLEERMKGQNDDCVSIPKLQTRNTLNAADNEQQSLPQSSAVVETIPDAELHVKYEQLQAEYGNQTKELESQTNAVETLQDRMHELQRQYEQLQGQCEGIASEASELKVTHDRQVAELSDALAKMKTQLEERVIECNRLQLELCEKLEMSENGYRENMRKYNREWEEGRDQFEQRILALEAQLQAASEKCRCVALVASLEERDAQLQTALNERERLETAIEESASELQVRAQQINELSTSLKALERQCESHIEAKSRAESSAQAVATQLASLQEQFAALKEHSETAADDSARQELDRELMRVEAANAQLLSEKAAGVESIRQMLNAVVALKEQKSFLLANMQQLKKSTEMLNSNLAEQIQLMRAGVVQWTTAHDKLLGEKFNLEQRVEVLGKQFAEQECAHKAEIARITQSGASARASLESAQAELLAERDELQKAVEKLQQQQKDYADKDEVLQSKSDKLEQQLHEAKTRMIAYDQLLVDLEHSEMQLTKATTAQLALEEEHSRTVAALKAESAESREMCEQQNTARLELEKQLQLTNEAAKKEQDELRNLNNALQTQLDQERSAMQRQAHDMQSAIEELRLKCESLQATNAELETAKVSLRAQLETVAQKKCDCERLRKQLKAHEKIVNNAETQRLAAAQESARQKRELDKLRAALNSKEITLQMERTKMETAVANLTAEKVALEQRLQLTQATVKRFESELALSKRTTTTDSANNSSFEFNGSAGSSGSPRTRRSIDRIFGEALQMKSSAVHFAEDKTSTIQQKISQKESADRRTRRLSTHDERRRQSYWSVDQRNVQTMTDPTDSNCKCIELDMKLQECERALLIQESRVTALNLQLKSHPLKGENAALLKRLQTERSMHMQEVKKYKEIIGEQASRTTHAIEAAVMAAKEAFRREAQKVAVATTLRPPIVVANADTQTEPEPNYEKLRSKYNDLKRICQDRHCTIKGLQAKIAEKENVDGGNLQHALSSTETAQIHTYKAENERLKKELSTIRQKYDCAKKVLSMRLAEIEGLREAMGESTTQMLAPGPGP